METSLQMGRYIDLIRLDYVCFVFFVIRRECYINAGISFQRRSSKRYWGQFYNSFRRFWSLWYYDRNNKTPIVLVAKSNLDLLGIPENLIRALRKLGPLNITAISNDAGVRDAGIGILIENNQVFRLIYCACK
jgi:hypothetical protein